MVAVVATFFFRGVTRCWHSSPKRQNDVTPSSPPGFNIPVFHGDNDTAAAVWLRAPSSVINNSELPFRPSSQGRLAYTPFNKRESEVPVPSRWCISSSYL
eukprot:Blabericola_migrator_1__11958@NODE_731_length_6696_cov_64_725298_g527_i0_p7_GENE_NODE_731_length_6696_cov_64_725298_g527_i0NODE_731_length_6696_cov_64_725298_g527_i0_p7_ORF_typecomplete_len100_score10_62DUF2384/PF09722_10/0_23_NODE_731_length_6696_cov_64_725298_g527_i028403139